jgi:riboflavin biosynthesis pyrimidine reductase
MQSVIPTAAADVDLHAHYGAGWLRDGGVRANFIASVDGAISAGGLSRGLQTKGDNRVFAALRDLADVVLVGSGTARAEGYAPIEISPARTQLRTDRGLAGKLPTAVVSGSLRLDPSAPLYQDPTTIVLTTSRADASIRAAMNAQLLDCGDDDVDLHEVVRALRDQGLTRVLCEGGPTLLASMAGVGALDELCLSIAPLLAGPGSGRLTAGSAWDGPRPLSLIGLLTEDDALFCRYSLGQMKD